MKQRGPSGWSESLGTEVLHLHSTTRYVLRDQKVRSVGELRALVCRDVVRLEGVGPVMVAEIRAAIEAYDRGTRGLKWTERHDLWLEALVSHEVRANTIAQTMGFPVQIVERNAKRLNLPLFILPGRKPSFEVLMARAAQRQSAAIRRAEIRGARFERQRVSAEEKAARKLLRQQERERIAAERRAIREAARAVNIAELEAARQSVGRTDKRTMEFRAAYEATHHPGPAVQFVQIKPPPSIEEEMRRMLLSGATDRELRGRFPLNRAAIKSLRERVLADIAKGDPK